MWWWTIYGSVRRLWDCSKLEADISLVIGKVDCRNAFNEISKTTILDVVADKTQMHVPYANCLLNATPTRTIFHDHHADVTVLMTCIQVYHKVKAWVVHFFNMGQSRPIRIARERHSKVFICLIADDTHVIGSPADVIAAIVTINVLFGLGNNYSQQDKILAAANNLHGIPSTMASLISLSRRPIVDGIPWRLLAAASIMRK